VVEKATRSFEELRREAYTLEKGGYHPKYKPVAKDSPLNIEVRLLSYDILLNELDKVYKTVAAKKYLKSNPVQRV